MSADILYTFNGRVLGVSVISVFALEGVIHLKARDSLFWGELVDNSILIRY